LGTLARAMEASEPEPDRTLRSLTGELFAPVLPGPTDVRVEVLRRGSGVSSYDARLLQGGELLARASATFGRPRRDRRRWHPPDPPTPGRQGDWSATPPLDVQPPVGPAFARFFEYRLTGPAPFGGTEPISAGWVRPRRPLASWGGPELVALADAWWPATYSIEPAPRPTATLSYALELAWDGTPLPTDRPLFYRARSVAACDGFVVELRELWTADGQALAFNQQTFVLI
ncbi:MAG TPA: thioesterase family protein, partial [Polyangiaceae bacterium]|nr:thioesterase family protein [Polyangiaceae bacterium]